MGTLPSLGIKRIEALHYYVRDLERTRRFFVDKLDFVETGTSGPEMEREGRQRSAAFRTQVGDFVDRRTEDFSVRARRLRFAQHPRERGVERSRHDVEVRLTSPPV